MIFDFIFAKAKIETTLHFHFFLRNMNSNSNCQWHDVQDDVSLPDTEVKTVAMELTPAQAANSYLPKVGQMFDVFIQEKFACIVAIFCQMDDGKYILLTNSGEKVSEPFWNWSEISNKFVLREQQTVLDAEWLANRTNLTNRMVENNCAKMLLRIAEENRVQKKEQKDKIRQQKIEQEVDYVVNRCFAENLTKGPVITFTYRFQFVQDPDSCAEQELLCNLLQERVAEKIGKIRAAKRLIIKSTSNGNYPRYSSSDITIDFS